MYRFLLSSKWTGWFLLAVLGAAVCVALANWQLDRRDHARGAVSAVETNYDRKPVPFESVRGTFASYDAGDEWTPTVLRGTYDASGQRIVRNRPLNGQPGYEVLVPLRLAGGEAVIIDRGWLPIGNKETGRPDEIPAAPKGEVTVVARIKPGEAAVDRGAPAGQLASIELDKYAAELDYPLLTGSYGLMAAESPEPAAAPAALPKPALDEGPHLSYAMQWFAFGLLLFVGYGYAARQHALGASLEEEDSGFHEANPAPRPSRPQRARKRPTAEEEEDAALDAQGFRTDGTLMGGRE
ncbi:SURF1 family protein [Arthrobacter sp. I2-34]|uniref:SURF1-like protein n=1 Tax=Arthrobacter hankyongi TaxID=2904801 RepID=A0ABS9L627_9MICC|nr:SURF1 family protein [Arthrobacter hankyongi]MCG2622085.1 SURF1 family protein [Arthrobacter hankyongi]